MIKPAGSKIDPTKRNAAEIVLLEVINKLAITIESARTQTILRLPRTAILCLQPCVQTVNSTRRNLRCTSEPDAQRDIVQSGYSDIFFVDAQEDTGDGRKDEVVEAERKCEV